jgi:hypothetical protein
MVESNLVRGGPAEGRRELQISSSASRFSQLFNERVVY